MPDPTEDDVARLAAVLADAEAEHALDVDHLAEMSPEEVAYLAHVDELEDPVSDGVECGGV